MGGMVQRCKDTFIELYMLGFCIELTGVGWVRRVDNEVGIEGRGHVFRTLCVFFCLNPKWLSWSVFQKILGPKYYLFEFDK